jgi:hypothetical protein
MKPTQLEKAILTLEHEQAAIARAIALLKAQRPTALPRRVAKIVERT